MQEGRQSGEFEQRGPEKGQAYGVASITNVLQGLEFPISKQDLMNRFGDRTIQWTKDNPQSVRDILSKVSQDRFNSMADVAAAVGSAVKGSTSERR
jgi:hypothetical protein